jgi:hypothetical protein
MFHVYVLSSKNGPISWIVQESHCSHCGHCLQIPNLCILMTKWQSFSGLISPWRSVGHYVATNIAKKPQNDRVLYPRSVLGAPMSFIVKMHHFWQCADDNDQSFIASSGILGDLMQIKILNKYIGDIDSFIGNIYKIVTYWFWLDRRRFIILVTYVCMYWP